MAKKKPAVKMPVKKPVAKATGKKPVAKAPSKKVVPMAKKAPVKKPVATTKKVAPKKVEKKPAPKSLKDTVLKAASKFLAKPKTVSKEPVKKLKEKEKAVVLKDKAKDKAALLKEKEKEAKEKAKLKEQEKLKLKADKEAEKERIKAEKEAAKLKAKSEKESSKKKSKKDSDEDDEDFDDEDLELGPDDEPAFGEDRPTRKTEDDDFDEFEEDYKKAKASKKSGKKAYEVDDAVDLFPTKQGKKYSSAVLADIQSTIADEIAQLREHFNWKEIAEAIASMDFFIDAKNDECIEKGCDNIRTTQSYCRLHYLRNWKTIQKKRDILKEGKLQEYIEELISKYPPKYIEALLSDLSDDKEFYRVLNELNITSEFEFEEDEFENAVDDDDTDDDIGIETISSSLRYEDE